MANPNQVNAAFTTCAVFLNDALSTARLHITRGKYDQAFEILAGLAAIGPLVPTDNCKRFVKAVAAVELEPVEPAAEPESEPSKPSKKGARK